MSDTDATPQVDVDSDIEQIAAHRAQERARVGQWGLDVAVFLFAILMAIVILAFQGAKLEVVAPVAIVGLSLAWLWGWRRGRRLYQRCYEEEFLKLRQELRRKIQGTVDEIIEETVEDKVQKALRERWR
jgi:Flp pilus assembly protein TadB